MHVLDIINLIKKSGNISRKCWIYLPTPYTSFGIRIFSNINASCASCCFSNINNTICNDACKNKRYYFEIINIHTYKKYTLDALDIATFATIPVNTSQKNAPIIHDYESGFLYNIGDLVRLRIYGKTIITKVTQDRTCAFCAACIYDINREHHRSCPIAPVKCNEIETHIPEGIFFKEISAKELAELQKKTVDNKGLKNKLQEIKREIQSIFNELKIKL